METPEMQPSAEKSFGKEVQIILKMLRHGDRDPKTNMLTEFGHQETIARAQESGLQEGDFDVIHAIGSTVGPLDEAGRGRAEATAFDYAKEIAKGEDFNIRKSEVLSYDKLKTPVPYNHRGVYDSFLPPHFSELSPEEKGKLGVIAQGKLMEYVLALDTPEARIYKEEAAGSIAYLIEHYRKVSHRLESGKKVFLPAGMHGTYMEFLFQRALLATQPDGTVKRGFKDLSEIGGQHNVSEAFTIKIETDAEGNDKELVLTFDNPERPDGNEMILDSAVVKELAKKYEDMHPEINGLRERTQPLTEKKE